ncbi:MAG: 50S ribosomal protein L24 [Pseudomonadales bacterium]|jgi:large subunit ribosomal protein L24|nr:50S ribosomal protein L24 [Pseudomonadales bacterium]HNI72089.1 50S ribosomal protein L24 [Accumulibacter sp.]HNW13837.1 50S ribosomal protein L24 [Anaerolineaceae bacterium]MCP5332280.1 50S ribosomal protein L24 [Pseudomonadales bacterium]HMU90759.1 50S ribosomal protein L24 [Pseudomonadales bacterium]
MNKLRTNDEVIILAGKDKGKRGKILRVFPDDRILVSGVNLIKKHQKPNPQIGVLGGIIEKEAPIHVSNASIFNASLGKADRVGFRYLEDGQKVRFFKSSNEVIEK